MAEFIVLAKEARALRKTTPGTLTISNPGAVDVYFDRDGASRLNRTDVGTVPEGQKLDAAGGSMQWPGLAGVIWFRAAADTKIEVMW